MARRKVKLAYIINDSARKATYNKRKNGLVKKLKELTTLCGVDGCLVVYNPLEAHPEVYPSHEGVHQVLERFKLMDESDQTKKMFDQEAFLQHRIDKAGEQLKRLRRDNNEREMTRLMFEAMAAPTILEGMGVVELNDLRWLIDQHTMDVKRRLERLAEARAKEEERAQANAAAKAGTAGAMEEPHSLFLEMMTSFQEQLDPVLALDNFWLE